ncbi:hypothetical protein [Roseimicrobium sp. ORNL1]|uniref:hypothetical protein n=1 Tax=Roseimicrobium sp. ORNL1 TaxID=2711231 RepID=UPI0013E0F742|nr:hypothetical protein [Roseimicrobium sp. ORNL1]QIF01758.1 hypothetical protein G5S37_09550 [Roseimicrobium sp. ORNL1]
MLSRSPRCVTRLSVIHLHLCRSLPAVVVSLVLAASLSSCSSKPKEKKNEPKYSQMKWSERVDQQFRNPRGIESGFTKKVYNAGKEVDNGTFKTKGFAGGKKYRDKQFKTDTYAQADKKSNLFGKMFKGSDKENAMANQTYESPLNRYGDKKSQFADKTSSFGDDTFKTKAEPSILKKQESSPRPLILQNDGQGQGYSEFDIQKLLKKD